MTISYKWLSEYLPLEVEPERLSEILTSIGLEVEKMEPYEEIKGGLKGLVIGEVLEVTPHPNADKLRLTKVNTGHDELQIVCGATNVAVGQKVVVAKVGTTIHPIKGDPLTMKLAKIRGEESYGMICAEDEIGLSDSHAGIMVLDASAKVGTTAEEYFEPYNDIIFEIGLTPNRMDAMSHWGVARDVCAYLSHHDRKEIKAVIPLDHLQADNHSLNISVSIENKEACKRYSGICISNVQVKASPKRLQQKLKSIGLRPINNIVDITNFIQHETGQPLHAFDYDAITGKQIIVKKLAGGTTFITLDEKEKKLSAEDLMICNGAEEGMCIAGVFGGMKSGVTGETKNIFLESAYFDPVTIRKTSFRHHLRTDAATRFEKDIDISNTVNVLKRAALLIKEITGGEIASDLVDIYPSPEPKKEVTLGYQYLKKLSGKNYHPDTVKDILNSLGFTVVKEGIDTMTLEVPYHKPDISLPADIVEEIVRIDGLDNIEIPSSITITPSIEENYKEANLKEKISNVLTGLGFTEILTNSITNSAWFNEDELKNIVKLVNNLSSELDIMRPSMLHTALNVVAFNLNHKNRNLKLFEFGKTYSTSGEGKYREENHLSLYLNGALSENNWKEKTKPSDIYYLKGIAENLLSNLGISAISFETENHKDLETAISVSVNSDKVLELGKVSKPLLSKFDIKQPVFFADFNWDAVLKHSTQKIQYIRVSKYPAVERDLAMVVNKSTKYGEIKGQIASLKLNKLQEIQLFDVFESEKLGQDKKSLAINFTFMDEEKTLTDTEIDSWMKTIMASLEKNVNAEIRKL